MSLTVKHINADASFLLTFSPEVRPLPSNSKTANGAYTVLIDPWLSGSSIVSAPWFATTKHNVPACIQHLSEIEEPDLVIVSQNKPDHCHGETLRQLRPEGKTIIAAEPGAAKAIKKWKHFDPQRVIGLPKYNPKEKFSSLRLPLSPLSSAGLPGEIVVSFIPAKDYLSGLHNAIGITYQPPTRSKTVATISTVELPKKTQYFHMPLSPVSLPPRSPPAPLSPVQTHADSGPGGFSTSAVAERPRSSGLDGYRPRLRSSRTGSSDFLPFQHMPILYSPPPSLPSTNDNAFPQPPLSPRPFTGIPTIHEPTSDFAALSRAPPTPPDSPASSFSRSTAYRHHASSSSNVSQQSSVTSSGSIVTPGRPRPVSVLFAPHGLPFSPDLLPYTQHHLVKLGALPLTLLLHSFGSAQNPWYLGGNIMTGSIGGAEIARGLMARCWLSAHDEDKDDRGIAVIKLKTTSVTPEQVRIQLWEGDEGEWLRKRGWNCDVRNLAVGNEMFIGPARDLLAGMEGKRESRLLKFEQ